MWLYFGMITAGLGTAWGAWRILRPAMRGGLGPSPDPAPVPRAMPWWWRLAWPGLAQVGPALDRFCPRPWRTCLAKALLRAGLPAQVREGHVLALSVAALIGGVGLVGVAYLLRQPVEGMVAALGRQAQWVQTPWPPAPLAGSGPAWAMAGAAVACTAALLPFAWLRAQGVERRRGIERGLPFLLDMMTLCVEAGLGAHAALQAAAANGPPGPLRDALAGALAQVRAGVPRTAAIQAMADRCGSPPVHRWATALAHADALGISLGPLLRAQAALCRSERHMRAERLAMQAPVKMLLPLIGCIFPCTFLVLAFPIAVQLSGGLG